MIAAADQSRLLKNLCREDLFIIVSEVFQTDTCDFADILLPATSQLEQKDLMYSWGHFNIQYNHKAIEPLGEAVSNTELFRRLAKVFSFDEDVFARNDDKIKFDSMIWDHEHMEDITLHSLSEEGLQGLMSVMPKPEYLTVLGNFQPHQNGLNLPAPKVKQAEKYLMFIARALKTRRNTSCKCIAIIQAKYNTR